MIPFMIISVLFSAEETFNPFAGPIPMLVFIQTNPWSMVIGSGTPRVAIYHTGEAIFVKTVHGKPVYHQVMLDKADLAKVRERMVPVLTLTDIQSSYNIAPYVTDQPEAMFYLNDGQRQVATTVYGLKESRIKSQLDATSQNAPEFRMPPEQLWTLHEWLCTLDFPLSREWTPPYVEVMLWDFSNSTGPLIQWPEGWPTLDSDRTITHGNVYSIFLDGGLLPEVQKFFASRLSHGAVELAGKKWAASYRHTFPREPEWRKAFAKASSIGN